MAWLGMWIDHLPTYLAALTRARSTLWPALGCAAVTLATAVRDGRRRTALNERLHELRRPLQALALMAPPATGPGRGDGPVEMAAAALARLEREINGEGEIEARAIVALRPLLEAARRRWSGQAALAGASIAVRWDADEAAVEGDRIAVAAALDNLIANALEHGRPNIELTADRLGERICLAVVDSGPGPTEVGRARRPSPLRRLSGRALRGHGLRLVRRTASLHDGSFQLHQGVHGTSAVLELPLFQPNPRGPASSLAPRPRRGSER